ncbi:MAG: hypothetical protein ACLQMH_09530 [Solirubrobacteraceae bacterium]
MARAHRGDEVRRLGAGVLALAISGLAVARAPASPITPMLSASVSTHELTYGTTLTVSGRLTSGGVGISASPLALQADAYPFRGFLTIAHGVTAADGSFALQGIRLSRNVRLRALAEGAQDAASSPLVVIVDPGAESYARSLGSGRTRLSVRLRHATVVGSASVPVWWYVASTGTRIFHLSAVTQTRELSPGLTYASAIVDPPSRRFVYRVCLNPAWGPAMGPSAAHRPCPVHDFDVGHDVG